MLPWPHATQESIQLTTAAAVADGASTIAVFAPPMDEKVGSGGKRWTRRKSQRRIMNKMHLLLLFNVL